MEKLNSKVGLVKIVLGKEVPIYPGAKEYISVIDTIAYSPSLKFGVIRGRIDVSSRSTLFNGVCPLEEKSIQEITQLMDGEIKPWDKLSKTLRPIPAIFYFKFKQLDENKEFADIFKEMAFLKEAYRNVGIKEKSLLFYFEKDSFLMETRIEETEE